MNKKAEKKRFMAFHMGIELQHLHIGVEKSVGILPTYVAASAAYLLEEDGCHCQRGLLVQQSKVTK